MRVEDLQLMTVEQLRKLAMDLVPKGSNNVRLTAIAGWKITFAHIRVTDTITKIAVTAHTRRMSKRWSNRFCEIVSMIPNVAKVRLIEDPDSTGARKFYVSIDHTDGIRIVFLVLYAIVLRLEEAGMIRKISP